MDKPKVKTALIDADILVFQAAVVCEEKFDWDGDGKGSTHCNLPAAKRNIKTRVRSITEAAGCQDYLMCFTNRRNFRYEVLPTYKHNRADKIPPEMLRPLREWTQENFQSLTMEWLEADDLIGILASEHLTKYVACSTDKDFKSIPCTLFNWSKDKKPHRISLEEANYWFHYQWMIGDTCDGYKGLPGCGPKCAERLLNTNPPEDWTVAVVELYANKCYPWKFITQQAQVARILRCSDYDWDRKKVILWEPLV